MQASNSRSVKKSSNWTVEIEKNLWTIQFIRTDEYIQSPGGFFVSSKTDSNKKEAAAVYAALHLNQVDVNLLLHQSSKAMKNAVEHPVFSVFRFSAPLLGLFQLSWQHASILTDPNT